MWRNHLQDIGLMYSLVDDLQLFWQYKAFEWDPLSRRVAQAIEEERRTHAKTTSTVDHRLEEILMNQESYSALKERILEQREEALSIANFLGVRAVTALQALSFQTPLPDNSSLEAAINEAESLAHHTEKADYWRQMLVYGLRSLYHMILKRIAEVRSRT